VRSKFLVRSAVGLVAVALLTAAILAPIRFHEPPRPPADPAQCNRACLEGLIDQYWAAVVAHDPKRLPLSADVQIHRKRSGHGDRRRLLENRGRPRQLHAHLCRPESPVSSSWASMREGRRAVLVSLRLRVELGRITEIEGIYFKPAARTQQHRRYGQALQARGHMVQVDSAGATADPSGADRDRRRILPPASRRTTARASTEPEPILSQRLPSHRERIAYHQRSAPAQRGSRHHQRVCHGLPVAVQAGLLFCGPEHSPPALPGG